jgi:hypothetical protein
MGYAVRDVPPDELERLVADPERLIRQNIHQPIKLDHTSVVVEGQMPLAGGEVRVHYKRHRTRTWWKRWLGLFRSSRALTAWQLGHGLLARGIATARPLAVCEPRRGKGRRDSYLATQWIEGGLGLHRYARLIAGYAPGDRQRRVRQLAATLGRLLGRMHGWHVSNRDLKGANLLVVERPDGVNVWLIDLDGVRIGRRLRVKVRAKNLARLATSVEIYPWISRTDRLRFLRAYQAAGAPDGPTWREMWRLVAAGSRAMIQRKERLGIPLS